MNQFQMALRRLEQAKTLLTDAEGNITQVKLTEAFPKELEKLNELIENWSKFMYVDLSQDPIEQRIMLMRKGYTVSEFAKIVGISDSTLGAYFKGVNVLKIDMINYMIKQLNELPDKRKKSRFIY